MLISYSNDDLLDKECAIPCKRCCHRSVDFLLRLSCLSVNQLLQPPQKYKLQRKHPSQRQGERPAAIFGRLESLVRLVRKSQRSIMLYQLNFFFFSPWCESIFSTSQLCTGFKPADSTVTKLFAGNYQTAKERLIVTLQMSQKTCASAVCHEFSPTAVTVALQETACTAAEAFESPSPAEMTCYDKSSPNQAFCQQQLEDIHAFTARTFSVSHCYHSAINVFIARTSCPPKIRVALQPEKTPV